MSPKDDIASHITKVESLARRLKDLGDEPKETDVITKIICTLPASYRGLRSAWDSTPADEQTLANLTASPVERRGCRKEFRESACRRQRRSPGNSGSLSSEVHEEESWIQRRMQPLSQEGTQGDGLLAKASRKEATTIRSTRPLKLVAAC